MQKSQLFEASRQVFCTLTSMGALPGSKAVYMHIGRDLTEFTSATTFRLRRVAYGYESLPTKASMDSRKKQHGFYRTRSLILSAWRKLKSEGTT